MSVIKTFSKEILDKSKEIKPGNSVRIHFKIKEGEKSRTQVFEGMIIKKRNNATVDTTITVRRISGGFGVERVFPLHSPLIEKIEITKIAKRVRRAKLNYLRDRDGKKARIPETVLNKKISIVLADETKDSKPSESTDLEKKVDEVNNDKKEAGVSKEAIKNESTSEEIEKEEKSEE